MIPNQFIHIKEKETFEDLKKDIQDGSIVFCKESGEIVTHGENYGKPLWKEIVDESPGIMGKIVTNYKAGDVVLYDIITNKRVIIDINEPVKNFSIKRYVPIAVIVIPKNHDIYGTGEAAAMSLLSMNCNTPNVGSNDDQKMYWGVSGVDITGLLNLNYVGGLGLTNGNVQNSVTVATNYGYLPSDKFTGKDSPQDPLTKYYISPLTENNFSWISSPYNVEGNRNPLYYDTSKTTSNALSDFNGVENTKKLISQRGNKDYSSWKPTYNAGADYPAASCCNMFKTEGTNQGDWYLPAMGELGYMMARWNILKASLQAIIDVGLEATFLDPSYAYWSSTEYSNNYAWNVVTNDGGVSNISKADGRYVRAFLRIR